MPFRILKIKFPKGAWRKPLFYGNIKFEIILLMIAMILLIKELKIALILNY